MSKQFDPRKVLRHISNDLLKQFFTARNRLVDVPWDDLTELDVGTVYDSWHGLPEDERRDVQVALQDVNELADDNGLRALAEEINCRCPHRMTEFTAIDSRIDRAMWMYLNEPRAFDDAARFAHADALPGRYWYKRNGLPRAPLQVTDEMKARLGAAVSEFYDETQGRGRWCHIDHYTRANRNEYFFVYLDNYPDAHIYFDEAGSMRKTRERGAFDNVFVYCPADGTLETFVPGGKKVREPLEEIFCDKVLDQDVGPAATNHAAYQLQGLMDPDFPFPTDPRDFVACVMLRRLRLDVINEPGRRVTLETGPKDNRNAIHHMIDRYLNTLALPRAGVRVTSATFTITFQTEGGGKPRTLTFDVGHPCSCNLKSNHDDVRAVGERCLKMWGIAA